MNSARWFSCSQLLPERCELCPRRCGANRRAGERGFCGADDRLRIARAALHFWEEPPISGSAGSGTVFFSHCPLQCVYCQNSEISLGAAGTEVALERLVRIFFELEAQGALNINCVTPTHYTPVIVEALRTARFAGLALPVVWNTSGYENVEVIRQLAETVDVYLTDFKYADASVAQRYSHAADYPEHALAALTEMVRQTGAYDAPATAALVEQDGVCHTVRNRVMVRHMVLPGHVEDSKRVLQLLWDRFGDSITYSIMNQYTPHHPPADMPELAQRVSEAEYEDVLDFADGLGIEDYYWQNGEAAEESFIPPFDLTGVHEMGK